MKRKTTAVLLLLRSNWFDRTSSHEAMVELDEDGDRIVYKLSPFLDIVKTWSIFSVETATAVSVELRSLEIDLVILVYQTRIDQDYIERMLKGVGVRPLVAWCYLPWRRIPQPMTYEDLVKGSSFYGMTASLSHLRELNVPFLAAFGSADDPSVLSKIETFSRAAQVANEMTRTHLGVLDDLDESRSPELDCFLSTFGMVPDRIPMDHMGEILQAIPNEAIDNYLNELTRRNVELMVTNETLCRGARTALALSQLARDREVNFLAVPDHSLQFRGQFDLCPGLPPGFHEENQPIYIPTTDYGAIASSVALQMISASPVFVLRIWFWDRAKNILVGGHGGIQNPNGISLGPMWVSGDYECMRDDPDGGAQLEFILKPGRITMLQINNTSSGCRAMAASGICLESEPRIEGIPHAVVRIDCSIEYFLQKMAESGGSAYWVICYGDYISELKALFELKAIRFDQLLD